MAKDKKNVLSGTHARENRTEGVAAQPRPIPQKVWTVQVWSYTTALWKVKGVTHGSSQPPERWPKTAKGSSRKDQRRRSPSDGVNPGTEARVSHSYWEFIATKTLPAWGGAGTGAGWKEERVSATPRHDNESAQRQTRAAHRRHVLLIMKEEGWVRGQHSEPGGEAENHTGEFPGPETTWSLWTSKLIGMMTFSSFHCLPFWSRVSVSPPVPHSPLDAWSR